MIQTRSSKDWRKLVGKDVKIEDNQGRKQFGEVKEVVRGEVYVESDWYNLKEIVKAEIINKN